MLANLFGHPTLREHFLLSFSYRATPRYEEGLRQRVAVDFPTWPLDLPNLDALLLPRWLAGRRLLAAIARQIAYLPLLAREVARLRMVLDEVKPDIVHINNGGYPGALSCRAMALAARLAGIRRVIMVVNNLAVPYDRSSRWLDWPVDRFVAGAVQRFVTGSAAAGHRLTSVLRLPPAQAGAIHNGIRVRAQRATVDQTRQRLGLAGFRGMVLGIVALHEPRKGHQVLLDALQSLHASGVGAAQLKLLVEGDGPLRHALQASLARAGLADMVQFVGVEEYVFDFMAAVDVLVLPSIRDEDFPNVILEAMSLGKPVIATRLAGIPEQVDDGVTGLLVDSADVGQLAQAVGRLAGDDAGRRAMGEAARQRFGERFACDIAMDNYLRLYAEILEQPPRRD